MNTVSEACFPKLYISRLSVKMNIKKRLTCKQTWKFITGIMVESRNNKLYWQLIERACRVCAWSVQGAAAWLSRRAGKASVFSVTLVESQTGQTGQFGWLEDYVNVLQKLIYIMRKIKQHNINNPSSKPSATHVLILKLAIVIGTGIVASFNIIRLSTGIDL